MDDRPFLKPSDIPFGTPRIFELDDPGNDGYPWFVAKPDNEYDGRPSPFWLMHVTERETATKYTLKLTKLMHSFVLALHYESGLGRGAVFSMEKKKDGRKTVWEVKLIEAGAKPASVPKTGGTARGHGVATKSGTFGNPTSEFGPMRNRNDVTVFTRSQARALWTEAVERSFEMVPQSDPESPPEVRAAVIRSRQSALSTFVIFAREAVPPSEFGPGVPLVTDDGGEAKVDRLRHDLFDKAMERNLSMPETGAEVLAMFLAPENRSTTTMAGLLEAILDDFEGFAQLVLQRMSGQENQDRGEFDENVDAEPVELTGENDEQDG